MSNPNMAKYRKFNIQDIQERETGKMGVALIIEDAHAYVPLYDADTIASIAKALQKASVRVYVANRGSNIIPVASSVLRNLDDLEAKRKPKFALNP